MSSAAQHAANRANAQKSTGPRTADGKKRSSRNAIAHGIFSREVVLANEERALFKELRSGLMKSLKPQDVLELMLFEQIVSAQWRLRRVHRAEKELHWKIKQ